MEKAVIGSEKWKPITSFLNGSSAFILVKEDLGGAIKAYQAFKKETKKTAFRGGVMQGQTLNEEQVKAIADLPSKEELIGQAAGLINSITAKIAIGMIVLLLLVITLPYLIGFYNKNYLFISLIGIGIPLAYIISLLIKMPSSNNCIKASRLLKVCTLIGLIAIYIG